MEPPSFVRMEETVVGHRMSTMISHPISAPASNSAESESTSFRKRLYAAARGVEPGTRASGAVFGVESVNVCHQLIAPKR